MALAAGDADLISLARPFLADPELIARGARRRRRQRLHRLRPGVHRPLDLRPARVVHRQPAGRATSSSRRDGDVRGASVAVVGGGPAGMGAARSLAASGAAVTVFEADDRLGGQFRMACRIPGKEDYERTIEYFEAELAALGVDVRLGARVDDVGALSGFDAVVVATGVIPRPASIPGAEMPHVISYAQLLTGDAELPDGAVAIVGAGGIGVDVAHLLSAPRDGGPADPRGAFYERYGLAPPTAGIVAIASHPR